MKAELEEIKELDRAARDEMRRLNPEIDELLYERSHAIDNCCSEIGTDEREAENDEIDELQDEISAIVSEENYDAFWQDFEDDDVKESGIFWRWRELQLALG